MREFPEIFALARAKKGEVGLMFDEAGGRVPSGWLPKGGPPSPKRVEKAVRRGEVVRLPPAMFERSKPGGGWEASPPRAEAWPRRVSGAVDGDGGRTQQHRDAARGWVGVQLRV